MNRSPQKSQGARGRTTPQLPYDNAHTAGMPRQAGSSAIALSEALVAGLAQARASGSEPGAVLLATLQILLYRYSGQEAFDLHIDSHQPRARRTGEIACRLDPSITGRQLIAANEVQLCRLGSADAQFPWLPSLSVAVSLFDHAERGPAPLPEELRTDADLHWYLPLGSAAGLLRYNAARFRQDTIARMIGHFDNLSKALLRAPDARISTLTMLSDAEREQLLHEWNSPIRGRPFVALHRHIEAHAATQPDAIAVEFREQCLSYVALDRSAARLARLLRAHGVADGAPVAVCLEPALDIAVCILAIFKAGGAYVPLDPAYPSARLSMLIEDIGPRAVLTREELAARLPRLDCPCLCLDGIYDTLDQAADALPLPGDPHPQQAAFVVYTSGTTGKPKGVVLSHANLIHYIGSARERYGLGIDDVMPAIARFSFSISLFELLAPLVAGGRVVILERAHVLDLRLLLQSLRKATIIHASPSLWRKLLAYLAERKLSAQSLPQLRHVSSGGDMVSADVMEALKIRFPQAERYVIYGCSEVSCMAVTYPIPSQATQTRNRIGKPFDDVRLRLLDPHGNLVPVGIAGEIHIGGAGVALGYLNRPELTRERFVSIDGERFYRTGDLARYDREGNLEILGRNDFQIKLRGMRIEPGEIEAHLRQAPGVRDAVVGARELPNGTTALVAYLVMRDGSSIEPGPIRQFLLTRLPDYMVPGVYMALDALPVNINQKLDRNALPAIGAAELQRASGGASPRNETERRLAAVWARVLGTQAVGVEDGFFELGGDSLLSISLIIEVEKEFGRALPLSSVLTDPTVRQQARLLNSESAAGQCVVQLREGGDAAPFFFVHDGEGEILPYRNLAFCLPAAHPVYAVRPHGTPAHPMLHTRLEEIAGHYTRQILSIRAQGPYLLGGLCIGGFLAFEIARRLRALGHQVGPVMLIDAAHVQAIPRSIAKRRLQSFSAALQPASTAQPWWRTLTKATATAARKLCNLLRYEISSRLDRAAKRLKFKAFRLCLDHGLSIPKPLRHISVNTILRCAEREYEMPARYEGEIVLLRASQRDARFDGTPVDDTPYAELFADPQLGWRGCAVHMSVHDLPGGHSSMLQSPNVEVLAGVIASRTRVVPACALPAKGALAA